jgi:queuosine precursor transporter
VKLDARLTLFITLVAVFMTCLVTGDLIGGKLTSVHLFGREWSFSVGNLAFPVTFILTDILNEFYGKAIVRQISIIAFAMVGLVVLLCTVADAMPWWSRTLQDDWGGLTPREFDPVFVGARRIQISSMFAFILANFVDISVFFLLKRITGDRFLWLRATGSTAISQLIDTSVITALAFAEQLTFEEYVSMVVFAYVVKLCSAIGVTPIIYGLHSLIEHRFAIAPAPLDPKP